MSIRHLAGCDRQHPPRQRCSSWLAPDDSTSIATARAAASRHVISASAGHRRAAAALVVGGLVAVIALTAIVVTRSQSPPTNSLVTTSDLPDWGRPSGGVELVDDATCDLNAGWLPPCRTLAFGINRPFEDEVRDLQATFESRAWSSQLEPHDLSLHARERPWWVDGSGTCIVFYEDDAQAAAADRKYQAVVGVVVDQCGTKD